MSEIIGQVVQRVAKAAKTGETRASYDYGAIHVSPADFLMLIDMFTDAGCSISFAGNVVTVMWGG